MVSYRYLVLLPLLWLASCAQVGTISGGPKDTTAPKPIAKKINPPNGSTHFIHKEVEIPFDEFFRLNNANLNIRMVPPHAAVNASVKGKSLVLNWEETLEPETTYAIYLNGAVKDITEGNDSILQYVFSTGAQIDTFSYTCFVGDAWNGKATAECIVALYDSEKGELRSFTETDSKGQAHLQYLKQGNYTLRAFIDENNDLKAQNHEAIAFPKESVLTIDSSAVDSIPLRMFTPVQPPKITSSVLIAPGYVLLGTNRPIRNEEVFFNGQKMEPDTRTQIADDSLQVFVDLGELTTFELALHSTEITDTVTLRVSQKARELPIAVRPVIASGIYSPWDSIQLFANDLISAIDTSLIVFENGEDSSTIQHYTYTINANKVMFSFANRKTLNTINCKVKPGAISTPNGMNMAFSKSITLQQSEKYGAIKLDLSYYSRGASILHVVYGNSTIITRPIAPEHRSVFLEGLVPGDYTFIVVQDLNTNGKWDVGDLSRNIQPEPVDHYSTPVKVRANWEVELTLMPSDEE